MQTVYAWLVTILGVLLVLPKIGVTQFGDLSAGILSWVIALLVLAIGIVGFFK